MVSFSIYAGKTTREEWDVQISLPAAKRQRGNEFSNEQSRQSIDDIKKLPLDRSKPFGKVENSASQEEEISDCDDYEESDEDMRKEMIIDLLISTEFILRKKNLKLSAKKPKIEERLVVCGSDNFLNSTQVNIFSESLYENTGYYLVLKFDYGMLKQIPVQNSDRFQGVAWFEKTIQTVDLALNAIIEAIPENRPRFKAVMAYHERLYTYATHALSKVSCDDIENVAQPMLTCSDATYCIKKKSCFGVVNEQSCYQNILSYGLKVHLNTDETSIEKIELFHPSFMGDVFLPRESESL